MRSPDWGARLIGALMDTTTNEETPGIAIYRNARLVILHNTLVGTYLVRYALAGDDCFNAFVRDTLAVQVSTSPNLHHYGNALPDIIAQSPLAHGVPYLANAARLEWCVHWAYHASDTHVEAADVTLPAQSANTIRAGLVGGTQWTVSPWPVASIWRAHQPGETTALNTIDLGVNGAAATAVHGHHVAMVDFDPPAATSLTTCEARASLQAAPETTLVEWPDSDPTACLSGLYRSGLLAPFACPTTLSTGDTP